MKIKLFLLLLAFHATSWVKAQDNSQNVSNTYKKRVLESVEVDLLSSYYVQQGDNAAVTGGVGTEELTDLTGTVVVSIPLNDDDILTIDAGVSAYTSASSSNINPFDGRTATPFQASSGASSSDTWTNFTGSYSHSSDDRNQIWSAKISVSSEYDYFSSGLGGSYSRLFNEKNTELSIHGNIYFDRWSLIYPIEFRDGSGENGFSIHNYILTGNQNYSPIFLPISNSNRNSYSIGVGFSQILHKSIQSAFVLDLVKQQGLLSTPFQRVNFSDREDTFIEDFQLADDIERLPDSRSKIAVGTRFNFFLTDRVSLRTFYRYYLDDWGIQSNTLSAEIPIKIGDKFTVYPSYRYYDQTAADYFAAKEQHSSSARYYTSDYDLSGYQSNQLGFGISYTDILTRFHVALFGLKSIDLKFYQYDRNTTFRSQIFTTGFKFVLDK